MIYEATKHFLRKYFQMFLFLFNKIIHGNISSKCFRIKIPEISHENIGL